MQTKRKHPLMFPFFNDISMRTSIFIPGFLIADFTACLMGIIKQKSQVYNIIGLTIKINTP